MRSRMQTVISIGVSCLAINFPLGVSATEEMSPSHLESPQSVLSQSVSSQSEPAGSNPVELYQTTVLERKPVTAASSFQILNRDFHLRVNPRPADILQVAPGMFAIQHAGGGKANQYYLRGFDADHGTDIAFFLDGVPVNNVSHGHGQGYTDLNFIIPEIIESIEINKGSYLSRYGNFNTAGALHLKTYRGLDESSISMIGGSFDTYRSLVIVSPEVGKWKTLTAAEIYHTNGPFQHDESLERYNVFSKFSRDFGAGSHLTFGYLAYSAGWNASGQIPNREVLSGRLDRFGSIDPTDGGHSTRSTLSAEWQVDLDPEQKFEINLYQTRYDLTLYSNFTFFLADPVNGDQIEQTDSRTVTGFNALYKKSHRFGSADSETSFGMQLRNDRIENALYSTRGRVRYTTRPGFNAVDAQIREQNIGIHAQEDTQWNSRFRTVFGLRADQLSYKVDDQLEQSAVKTSGTEDASIVSPKANLIFGMTSKWDAFVSYGEGFHSNDARGVVRLDADKVTPFTKSRSYEVGTRGNMFDERIEVSVSLFQTDLGAETVWVGDEGTTELLGRSRRQGVEFESRYKILPWLTADLDATVTNGRLRDAPDDANKIPLAPRHTVSAGLAIRHPMGYYGRLGVLSLGNRPANETGSITAEGFTRVDLSMGYQVANWDISIGLQNLTDAKIKEAQFATESQLQGEGAPVEELHFTPGAPFNAFVVVKHVF